MTKKIVLTLLAGSLVALPACGGDDNKSKSSSGTATKLSADSKKVLSASADAHGLGGTAKSTGAQSIQDGQSVDTTSLEQNIVQTIKQKAGIDVRVECPPTVQYANGAVFFCKLYTPSGTAYDVKCTLLPDGIQWELITTQPTPAPTPSTPTTPQLKKATGDAKGKRVSGGGANSLQPGDTLDTSTLDDQMEATVKQKTGLDVNVECPDTVDYSPGAVFYCKLYTSDGTAYDVKCTQGNDGDIAWEVITTKQ